MKYCLLSCINGAFRIESEWGDLNKAKANFHAKCQTLWNAADVSKAHVMIVNEQLECVDGYKEYIYHE